MKTNLASVFAACTSGAVGSFNVLDAEMAMAVVQAAEDAGRPVVVGVAARHFAAIQASLLAPTLGEIAARCAQPVALHLDHAGPDQMGLIQRALDLGFTSIMIDGSTLPLADNIRATQAVVELAQSYRASVEGELGAIGGEEGVADTQGARLKTFGYTHAGEAARYVDATGVDALAIAVGTAHGIYAAAPKISFKTISAVHRVARAPLVLHGATGVKPEDIRRCVELGIRKINFFSGFLAAAMERARRDSPQLGYDYLALKQRTATDWRRLAHEQIELFAATPEPTFTD